MQHDVVVSPSMRLCYNMANPTAPTNINDQINISSVTDRFSSTVDPRTFAYRSRPTQVTPRRSRSRCTHARSIPVTQTAIQTLLSIREPLMTSRLHISTLPPSDTLIAAIRTSDSLVPVVPVAPVAIAPIVTLKTSPIAIVAPIAIAPIVKPIVYLVAQVSAVAPPYPTSQFALIVPPIVSLLFLTIITITLTLTQLSLHTSRFYVRKHIRLKGI